jgi:hypothetical protein
MNSPQGRVPQFVRWSELYDIDRLRQSGVDADDFHDVNIDRIDRAVLATGGAMAKLPASVPSTPNSDDALLGHLQAHPCKHGRTGLQSNFSFEFDSETNAQAGVGELYGRHLRIDALRCGALPLSRTETQKALAAWLGDVPIAAVFDVGHHAHTIVSDMKVFVKLDQGLRPSALLDHEAIVVTGAPRNRIRAESGAVCMHARAALPAMPAVPCEAWPGRPSGDAMPVLCCCDRHAAWG